MAMPVAKELKLKAVVGAKIVIVPDELYEGHLLPLYFLIAFSILLDNVHFVQRGGPESQICIIWLTL